MVQEAPKIDLAKIEAVVDAQALNKAVDEAYKNALSKDEFDTMLAENERLTADFVAGRITEAELDAAFASRQYSEHRLAVKTIPEFRYIITRLIHNDPEEVHYMVAHENAHMSTLLSLGLQGTYGLLVVIDDEKDSYHVLP